MTKADLVNAAKDLNEMLGLDPAIDTSQKVDDLKAAIKEGGLWLQAQDTPKPETVEVLRQLDWSDADFENLSDDQADIRQTFESLGILAVEDEEEEPEEVPEEVEEEEEEAPKARRAPAAKKEKKVGVISTIVELLEKAGAKGISKDAILEELLKRFPERAKIPMKNTINVQVPGRITKERFPVERLDNGNYRKAK